MQFGYVSALLMPLFAAAAVALAHNPSQTKEVNAQKSKLQVAVEDRNLNADQKDAFSVATDLQTSKRKILAMGEVDDETTLLISGSSGDSGYLASVDVDDNGVFMLKNPLAKLPSNISSDSVIFLCPDSSGSKLITMSKSKVGAFNLPDGSSADTKIALKHEIENCYRDGEIHLSSSQDLTYYTVESSKGNVAKFRFDKANLTVSDGCSIVGNLGLLCTSDSGIAVSSSSSCKGSPISNLIAGYVDNSTTYLVDSANTVYVFSSSIFSGNQSVPLTKVTSKEAWKGQHKPTTPKPIHNATTEEDKSGRTKWLVIIIAILLVLCIICGIFFWCRHDRGKKSNKGGKGAGRAGGKAGGKSGKSGKKIEEEEEDIGEEDVDEKDVDEKDFDEDEGIDEGPKSSNASNIKSDYGQEVPSKSSSSRPKQSKMNKSKVAGSSSSTQAPPSFASSASASFSSRPKLAKQKKGKQPLLKSKFKGKSKALAKSQMSSSSRNSAAVKSQAKSSTSSKKSGKSGKSGKSSKSSKSGKSGKN